MQDEKRKGDIELEEEGLKDGGDHGLYIKYFDSGYSPILKII